MFLWASGEAFDALMDLASEAVKDFCCRSMICLNITLKSHTIISASATLVIPNCEDEAIETYYWVLSSIEDYTNMWKCALKRVLKDHTYNHYAEEFVGVFENCATRSKRTDKPLYSGNIAGMCSNIS